MNLTKDILGINNLYNKSIYEVYDLLKMVHRMPFFDNSVSLKIIDILNDKIVTESFFNSNEEIDNYIINGLDELKEKKILNNKIKKSNNNKIIKKKSENKRKKIINEDYICDNISKENKPKKKNIKFFLNKKNTKSEPNCSIEDKKIIRKKEKKYKCELCNKSYSGASGLFYHNKINHGHLVYRNKKK